MVTAQIKRFLPIVFLIGLVLWGTYTLLTYLGVPIHLAVLITDEAREYIRTTCTDGDLLCQGLNALIPFVSRSISRLEPFAFHGLWSLILFAGLYLKTKLRPGPITLRPVTLFGIFLLSAWLLFTGISNGQIGGADARRIIEPSPEVYKNAGPQSLAHLTNNYELLKERGCLNYIGQASIGVGIYNVKHSCVQLSFFTRVLTPLFILFLIFLTVLAIGRMILARLHYTPPSLLLEFTYSAGTGVCTLIALLWLHAVLGIYTQVMGWALLIALPIIALKHTVYWIRTFLFHRWDYSGSLLSIGVLLAWLLISYLAFNYLTVVRPFPIGWDDLGSYLNRPRLLVSYGQIISTMSGFMWEYLTSLGFLLFGFASSFGTTVALEINWAAGLIAVLFLMTLSTVLLRSYVAGLLTAVLYYTLPLVGHFSFADMKIDNATFAFSTLTILAVFQYLFPTEDEQDRRQQILLLALAGVFGGFAFGMKVTAIMVLLSLGITLIGARLHWTAFIGGLFLAIFVLDLHVLNLSTITARIVGEGIVISDVVFRLVCIGLGLGLVGIAVWKRRTPLKPTLIAAGVFAGMFIASLSPWILRNNIVMRNFPPVLQLSTPNKLAPVMAIRSEPQPNVPGQMTRSLPDDLRGDFSQCETTGHIEELDRYWGFEKGWGHYLTLPWRTVLNLDSAGYYVTTMSALLLLPLLLLLPFFWSREGRWLRWLTLGTGFVLLQWMFLANGVPWYGLGMFAGLTIGLTALAVHAPGRSGKIIMGVFLAAAVLSNLNLRAWQYEMQKNILEYPLGKITASALMERTIPYYDDIGRIVAERAQVMPDHPYLYRVGTFIPYFIPKNLEIIPMADHQLDFFNCLFIERDTHLTLKRLKALGFNSLIFDTNTATIEKDTNGTLHQKVNALLSFLNDRSLGLQPVVNDVKAGVAFVLLP